MSSEEPQLRVQSDGKVLGPMTIVDVANLLAEGRISERDLISDGGGPWKHVEQYVLEQSGGAGSQTGAESDALFNEDFAIDFAAAPSPPPSEPDHYTLAEPVELDEIRNAKRRARKPKAPPPDDSVDRGDEALLDAIQALAREQNRDTERPRPRGKRAAKPVPLARGVVTGSGTQPALPPGMTSLIQGRDFTGWKFFPDEDENQSGAWSVQGGIVRFDGSSTRPHLLTTATFANFELWIAWKSLTTESRGGVFLRSDLDPEGTRDWISLSTTDAGRMLGPNSSGTRAVPDLQKPAGEWNLWRILAAGERVGLWCNQRPAWNAGRLAKRRGSVGLRGDGSPLEYKLIQIREIRAK